MMKTMKRLFGTDGMRGEAGQFPLDQATVHVAGRSLARQLKAKLGRAPQVVTGRDTRESGAWIERAFIEGVLAAGAEAASAGVITTPGVAYLARTLPADAASAPAASTPSMKARSIQAPDSRVSRPVTTRGVRPSFAFNCRASDCPATRTVARSSGNRPASPRIPSVPKSLFIVFIIKVQSRRFKVQS